MRTKEDENMQAYIAEQVSEILNERPRRKKAPARRALGGAALALLITILTVVVAVRALAVCDEPPAGTALPAFHLRPSPEAKRAGGRGPKAPCAVGSAGPRCAGREKKKERKNSPHRGTFN